MKKISIVFGGLVGVCAVFVACIDDKRPIPSNDGGTTNSSSSSSTATSSSGAIEPTCTSYIAVAPMVNDGWGYLENGVFACRRMIPPSYPYQITKALFKSRFTGTCTQNPQMTSAVGDKAQLNGFKWGEIQTMDGSGDGFLTVDVKLVEGQAFFACAILSAPTAEQRACLEGCYTEVAGMNDEFFWGDTLEPALGGTVITPPSLEPLKESPTLPLAVKFKNDRLRLAINIVGVPVAP